MSIIIIIITIVITFIIIISNIYLLLLPLLLCKKIYFLFINAIQYSFRLDMYAQSPSHQTGQINILSIPYPNR